jgi:predicted metal-binding membrane protein
MSTKASSPELTGAALLALAGAAWVLAAGRMAGMDAGPGTALGAPGWFAVTWLVMMAAMMLPSLVPAALGRPHAAAFVAGYLVAWTGAGLVAYLAFAAVRSLHPAFAAWDRGGRFLAAAVILAAAAYQLSPTKAACLERCRQSRQNDGLRHGAACVGCCAGLMAALFALGVMSITWMVVIAALIAGERLLPWRRPAVYAVAATLAVLAIWLAVAPGELPGLTLPGPMTGM